MLAAPLAPPVKEIVNDTRTEVRKTYNPPPPKKKELKFIKIASGKPRTPGAKIRWPYHYGKFISCLLMSSGIR